MIVDWYNDQAPYERAQQRRIRAGSANEFVALRKNQIQIQYVLDQENRLEFRFLLSDMIGSTKQLLLLKFTTKVN